MGSTPSYDRSAEGPTDMTETDTPRPPRARLPKSARILDQRGFRAVRAARRSVADDVLAISWRPNDLGETRLGLAISIRGIGAVGRNRIRRLVREAFRLRRMALPVGLDLVVMARDTTKAQQWPSVSASFDALIERIRRADKPRC